ncbi:MAG: protoporphyrinogen oxidase [Candidatus Tectimicrobiota bacterium]|nr:MAG: protoporphyrinogen oxidase [Candidatus Tectomicrobia bacterium]
MPPKHLVVIGGGISGLTACYRLWQEIRTRRLPARVSLLEASGRLGGVIATSHVQGLLLEHGPDCFLTAKPWGLALCRELGLDDELLGTTPQHRRSFVVRQGRLVPLPPGMYLMAPSSLWSLLATPLLSWPGKLRMALDLVLPRRRATGDESLAQFVTRRLGREALERLAQPLVGGIYTADPNQLSMQATLPQFVAMEQQHRSLILAMRRLRRQQALAQDVSGPRYGLFATLRQGMQTLVDALAARLPAEAVRLNARVQAIRRQASGGRWQVCLPDGAVMADALCLALPAPQAGQLLAAVDAELAALLQAIPYAAAAVVNLAYERQAVAHPLDGMGFVVPAVERRALLACSFSSVKFAGRAPQHLVLLRVFVGGAQQPEAYALADEALIRAVCQDLAQLLGIRAAPVYVHLSRHPQAMAQYPVGHLERVARLEKRLARLPGLALAGNAYRGIGVPDCIHSGQAAAQRLIAWLTAPQPAPSLA